MGVTETLRILLTILLSTACIQNVRLFGVYDVRWPFLAEIHTAPLKRFVPSSILQAVRALRNAPAASAVFLAGVAPVPPATPNQRFRPANANYGWPEIIRSGKSSSPPSDWQSCTHMHYAPAVHPPTATALSRTYRQLTSAWPGHQVAQGRGWLWIDVNQNMFIWLVVVMICLTKMSIMCVKITTTLSPR